MLVALGMLVTVVGEKRKKMKEKKVNVCTTCTNISAHNDTVRWRRGFNTKIANTEKKYFV